MIFAITPLVQEAKTRRRWWAILGIFTAAMLIPLGLFGAAVAWAGSTVVARVTTPHGREVIASLALTGAGVLSIGVALGELGLSRPLLPAVVSVPARARRGSLPRRALFVAIGFGVVMAIFSPLPTYALVLGWVAAQQSAGLGAVTLMAYGLGLVVPLAIAGTLIARRGDAAGRDVATFQERVRPIGGISMAVAGGLLLSMWTLRATWALFLTR